MKFYFILAFVFISIVDGRYLIKNGLLRELITFISLMGIAVILAVYNLFNLPTPIQLLTKLF